MSSNFKDILINDTDLSVRSKNALLRHGILTVGDMLDLDEEKLYKMRNLGTKSVFEILNKIKLYCETDPTYVKPSRPGVFGLIDDPEQRDTVLEYVKNNDLDLDSIGLSNRARNQLARNNYTKMSDVVFLTESDLQAIPALGGQTVKEIAGVINDYLVSNEKRIMAYCSGDIESIADDEGIRQNITALFNSIGFEGLSLGELKDRISFPEGVTDDRIKAALGRLISEGVLEYVDFRCYRVYPEFEEVLEHTPKVAGRNLEFVKKRLEGITLEAIAQTEGLTRERVRQIVTKAAKKAAEYNFATSDIQYFDEDYYRYFYNTYAFDKKEGSKWFGVSSRVWNYLDMIGVKRGEKPLEEAPEDSNLDLGFRLKIENYLNRNRLLLDGEWIDNKREEVEKHNIRILCKDDVPFNDFVNLYNDHLKNEGIAYNPSIYITDEVYATRKNRIMELRCALWKQNEKIRYYDIEGQDFTELLDALNLSSYENIEISTAKLMEEHPDIMQKYDIRDQYELHNLLRKIIKEGDFNDFRCNRMPNIQFGQFDRDMAILQILIDNAPISTADLVDLIHDEYGYDKGTILGSYLSSIYKYYHDGIYSIDQKTAPDYQLDMLSSKLTGNFYYFDEIRDIYKDLFKDADPEAINPYTIKKMGFNVYSKYALRGYDTLEAYFNELLTKDDIVDLTPLRKRYTYVVTFTNKLMELKRDLQVIEFEPNMLINIRKLEAAGVTKEMIRDYCEAVYDFVGDGEFFSAKSIRNDGFESSLYDLGFSDWFYGNLLIGDPRFAFGTMYGNMILKKGTGQITAKDFAYEVIKENEIIDRYDLISEFNDRYGCSVSDIWDVFYKVQDTGVYYDKILDRIYLSKDLYYQEMEETEEL